MFHKSVRLDEFQNISSREPLSLAEGGSAAPVDLLVIKHRLQQCPGSWSVTRGGNAAWVSQAPILESGVKFLRDAKFREPTALKVTVVVSDSLSNPCNVTHRAGTLLRRISQEELHHAWILATYRDVKDGKLVQDRMC